MPLRPPLRLVPRADDRAAREAALVEAVLTGLPPGGRVAVVGPDEATAWLADALGAVDVTVVRSPLPEATRHAPVLFDDADGFDAVVVEAAGLGPGAARSLGAIAGVLAPGGRLLVQAPTGGGRSLGDWVRLFGAAGLVLRDVREPEHGGLAGCVFVTEPDGAWR